MLEVVLWVCRGLILAYVNVCRCKWAGGGSEVQPGCNTLWRILSIAARHFSSSKNFVTSAWIHHPFVGLFVLVHQCCFLIPSCILCSDQSLINPCVSCSQWGVLPAADDQWQSALRPGCILLHDRGDRQHNFWIHSQKQCESSNYL